MRYLILSLFLLVSSTGYAEITKQTETVKVEVLECGIIQYTERTSIIEDGKVIATKIIPYVVNPDESVLEKPQRVKDIAEAVKTENIVTKYKAKKDKK